MTTNMFHGTQACLDISTFEKKNTKTDAKKIVKKKTLEIQKPFFIENNFSLLFEHS